MSAGNLNTTYLFPWTEFFVLCEELENYPPEDAEARLEELVADGLHPEMIRRLGIHLGIEQLPRPEEELAPDTIVGGEYRIVKTIGKGGMGVVYEAVLEKVGHTVALKMILPGIIPDEMRQRFLLEMKALGRLDHPGIVSIRHAGTHVYPNGKVSDFFVMDRIAGVRLQDYMLFPEATFIERIRIVRDAALAVEYAHDRGVIHRDLKPGNMLLRSDGRVVLFDFGLASAIQDGAKTLPGAEGTIPYMAPEQAEGTTPSPAADIYSLGAILYEVLTGEPHYRTANKASRTEKLALVRRPPRRRPLDLTEQPAALESILDKALAQIPEERFPSAAAFARSLNRLLPAHLTHDPPHKWHPAAGLAVPATDWILEKKLGDGSHGQVWFASNRPVIASAAEPLIPPPRVYKFCATEEAARSLRREQRVFQALKRASDSLSGPRLTPAVEFASDTEASAGHRNEVAGIVPLEAWSLDEPPYYIAMRWIEDSSDLRDWVNRTAGNESPVSPPAADSSPGHEAAVVSIICSVANALHFASQNGVIHRDVSPGNILVRNDAEGPGGVRAWLIDFGLSDFDTNFAQSLLSASITDTRSARLVGSPEYIAPEIKRGAPATTQSDIYSLGVIFYRLLRRDLTATLTEWKQHIHDPFLREDLERCLSDRPEDRFPHASVLAERMRTLPGRRSAAAKAAQAAAEAAAAAEAVATARERAAYRRGILRTFSIAAGVILCMAILTFIAVQQKNIATNSRARMALDQAKAIVLADAAPGRRQRGLDLLGDAASVRDAPVTLRSTAASLFSLSDLLLKHSLAQTEQTPGKRTEADLPEKFPVSKGETFRAFSHDGQLLAVARTSDSLSGEIDLIDTLTGGIRRTLRREKFPWMPVVESGLLRFSQDDQYVALAGPATSKHVLVFSAVTGRLEACLFHGQNPSSLAWHPAGRLLATGSPDSVIRVWDLAAALSHSSGDQDKSDFAMAPELNEAALDFPLCDLTGHRGAVTTLCFNPDTGMLFSSDAAGYFRLWKGFHTGGLPGVVSRREAAMPAARLGVGEPTLLIEKRIDASRSILEADFRGSNLTLTLSGGKTETYEYQSTVFPEEIHLGPGLASLDWHAGKRQVCVISGADIYWAETSPLSLLGSLTGKNPVSVAFDAEAGQWSVPDARQFLQYKPLPQDKTWTAPATLRFKIGTPKHEGASQTLFASAPDGRGALYCGRAIQFVRAGQVAEGAKLPCLTTDGVIHSLKWDPSGRLLMAAFKKDGGELTLESWSTSGDFPPSVAAYPVRTFPVEHAIPVHVGGNTAILLRGVLSGLTILDPAGGGLVPLDQGAEARQDFPIALSHDGHLLAAISERHNVRIYDFPARTLLAVLTHPRHALMREISWHPVQARLATLTGDGYLQHWDLQPWLTWLKLHDLGF